MFYNASAVRNIILLYFISWFWQLWQPRNVTDTFVTIWQLSEICIFIVANPKTVMSKTILQFDSWQIYFWQLRSKLFVGFVLFNVLYSGVRKNIGFKSPKPLRNSGWCRRGMRLVKIFRSQLFYYYAVVPRIHSAARNSN